MRRRERISALIVTRGLGEILPETLESIERNRDLIEEVVVVSKTEADKPRWCDKFVVETGPIGKARNAAVDNARLPLVLMVDSDVVLTREYVEKLSEYFKSEKIVAVAPRLLPLTKGLIPELEAALVDGYSRVHRSPPCGGTAYRREVVRRVRFNDVLTGGEDRELHKRLKNLGYEIVYARNLRAYHNFRSNLRSHVRACMHGGTARHAGLIHVIARLLAAPVRGALYALKADARLRVRVVLPFYYVLKWFFIFLGKLRYTLLGAS